jgi:hypothetical protein
LAENTPSLFAGNQWGFGEAGSGLLKNVTDVGRFAKQNGWFSDLQLNHRQCGFRTAVEKGKFVLVKRREVAE